MTLLLLVSCAQPVHLQYDFGRANWEAQRIQADLARPSVSESVYPLSGVEAAEIRKRAEEASSDEESGQQESTK
ncbi:MAG: hypothetical protein ACK4YP_17290 [Myxococcota bacterium]